MLFVNNYTLKNFYKRLSYHLYFYLLYPSTHPFWRLQLRAAATTTRFALEHLNRAIPFGSPRDMLRYGVENCAQDGAFAEFGVYRGSSINFLAKRLPGQVIYGFDSFEGLPGDWLVQKAFFSLRGKMPKVRRNVRLVKGWFDETAPAWFNRAHKISFLHIDCDLYASTRAVLTALRESPAFEPSLAAPEGIWIQFDDFFNQPFWEQDSFKAFEEFLQETGVSCQYVGYSYKEALVRLWRPAAGADHH